MRGSHAILAVLGAGLVLFALAALLNHAERAAAAGDPADAYDLALDAVRPPGPPSARRGAALIERYGCLSCHTLDGRGARIAPDLSGVGARWTRAGLLEWLRDPQAVRPGTGMPTYRLPAADERAIADYLLTK